MQPFVWNSCFETGVATVDTQHRHLVDLINRVSGLLIAGGETSAEVPQMLAELQDYARFHFATEEELMAASGIDRRHFELHCQHHRQFVAQVEQMWATRAAQERPLEILEGFLSSWLSFHILGVDQAGNSLKVHQAPHSQRAIVNKHLPPLYAFELNLSRKKWPDMRSRPKSGVMARRWPAVF